LPNRRTPAKFHGHGGACRGEGEKLQRRGRRDLTAKRAKLPDFRRFSQNSANRLADEPWIKMREICKFFSDSCNKMKDIVDKSEIWVYNIENSY
jgi:hypothetical protein